MMLNTAAPLKQSEALAVQMANTVEADLLRYEPFGDYGDGGFGYRDGDAGIIIAPVTTGISAYRSSKLLPVTGAGCADIADPQMYCGGSVILPMSICHMSKVGMSPIRPLQPTRWFSPSCPAAKSPRRE